MINRRKGFYFMVHMNSGQVTIKVSFLETHCCTGRWPALPRNDARSGI